MKPGIKILLLANFINIFGYAFFAPLYAIFAQKINANVFVIASSWGAYTITTGILMLIIGRLENSMPNKKYLVVLGYFILSFGALSFLLVQNTFQLFAVQLLNAIGTGIVTPAWKTLYSKSEDKGEETKEWSFYDGGNMLFIGMGSVIGGFLVKEFGFSALFVVIFFIQLTAAFISLNLLRK